MMLSFLPEPLHDTVFYLEGNAVVCFLLVIDKHDWKKNNLIVFIRFHFSLLPNELELLFFLPVPPHNTVSYLKYYCMLGFPRVVDNDRRREQDKLIVLYHCAFVLENLGPVFCHTLLGRLTNYIHELVSCS